MAAADGHQPRRRGNPFTPDGAWEFVAEQLEDENQTVRWVELRKPPGKKALEFIVTDSDGVIYVKVQLGSGTIKEEASITAPANGTRMNERPRLLISAFAV